MEKEYKTYSEKIEILKSRNLIIQNEELAIKILQKTNYYSLINGYKELFISENLDKDTEMYKNGTEFMEIYSLYEFDRKLRKTFLEKILIVENNLKSLISDCFSEKYSHRDYIKIENFDNEENKNLENIIRLISNLHSEIAKQLKKKEAIKHYLEKHKYLPLWVLVNFLTFGTISKFYGLMKESDCRKIAKNFTGVDFSELKIFMINISEARNICAHEERLFNAKLTKNIPQNMIHKKLEIEQLQKGNSTIYTQGLRDIFSILISLKLLLSKEDFEELFNSIDTLLENLNESLNTVESSEVLKKMGFPHNWKELKNI